MQIIKAPFSGGSLGANIGCEKAPDAVISELENCYVSEGGNPIRPDVKGLKLNNSNIDESFMVIEEFLSSLDDIPILIGGDHSITYPAFRAFAKKHKIPGLLVLDAHPDAVNEFSPPSHEDFLRMLVKDGLVKPEHIVLVGIRNPHKLELDFLKQHNIRTFFMKQCHNLGINELTTIVMENCLKFPSLYLSIDIDAADPAFAPGTGHPEPGGFSSRELLHMVQRLALMKNLAAMDLVEINPDKDINGITARLGARVVKELLKPPQ